MGSALAGSLFCGSMVLTVLIRIVGADNEITHDHHSSNIFNPSFFLFIEGRAREYVGERYRARNERA